MNIKTIKNQPDPSIRTLIFLYRQSEKMEIIRLVRKSELSIKKRFRNWSSTTALFTAGITVILNVAKLC